MVCLSDTHNLHDQLVVPEGDILLFAGDMTLRGTESEVERFAAWLTALPHPVKVVVAGNHDFLFQSHPTVARRLIRSAIYLEDSGAEVMGLRIWGSPWQPWFLDWAFNLPRGAPLRAKWALIPEGTDILVTHAPPQGIGDRIVGDVSNGPDSPTGNEPSVGCADLRAAIERLRPRLHVFGHIHQCYGRYQQDGTVFVNASACDGDYRVTHPPVVVDLLADGM